MQETQKTRSSWFDRLTSSGEDDLDPSNGSHGDAVPQASFDAETGSAPAAAERHGEPSSESGNAPPSLNAPPTSGTPGPAAWTGGAEAAGLRPNSGVQRTQLVEQPMSTNPTAGNVAKHATTPVEADRLAATPSPPTGEVHATPRTHMTEAPTGPAQKWQVEELQHRWLITQAQLLDDPREAVREAGQLIGEAMQLVTATFTEQRSRIEREWKENAQLDTDELRAIMQRYRDLFKYVLSVCKLPQR